MAEFFVLINAGIVYRSLKRLAGRGGGRLVVIGWSFVSAGTFHPYWRRAWVSSTKWRSTKSSQLRHVGATIFGDVMRSIQTETANEIAWSRRRVWRRLVPTHIWRRDLQDSRPTDEENN